MKLRDLQEANVIDFSKREYGDTKSRQLRGHVRRAIETNLVVKDWGHTYYIISDIPPLTSQQWDKLKKTSFEDRTKQGVAQGGWSVAVKITTWPPTHVDFNKRTDKILSKKRLNQWSAEKPQGAYGKEHAEDVKTMEWKEFVDYIVTHNPPQGDDFDE